MWTIVPYSNLNDALVPTILNQHNEHSMIHACANYSATGAVHQILWTALDCSTSQYCNNAEYSAVFPRVLRANPLFQLCILERGGRGGSAEDLGGTMKLDTNSTDMHLYLIQ